MEKDTEIFFLISDLMKKTKKITELRKEAKKDFDNLDISVEDKIQLLTNMHSDGDDVNFFIN